MKKTKLMLGDNIESLKKIPENSIDSIVTDPPYGLSFMGKKWDYDVPSVEFWREVYRVLKPGGHILSFGGTRTYHRMVVNIEDAGFEIRDQVMWLYGSGFPKSHNIGKAVDKIEGKDVPVAKKRECDSVMSNTRYDNVDYKVENKYEGWGTALKPANEPICVARKPLSEKTIADNVIKWGTGGINIDGCRVGTELISHGTSKMDIRGKLGDFHTRPRIEVEEHITEGRFPANIILDETAAELLDEQSGISKSSCKSGVVEGKDANVFNDGENKTSGHKKKVMVGDYNDKGGASRFFYVAKVSKKERNLGLDGFEEKQMTLTEGKGRTYNDRCANCKKKFIGPDDKICNCENPETDKTIYVQKNNHPTLKPINLMTYLCRLITPEGGIVLDPFMGSGSTGISALLEGFRFVGMEMDKDYFKIAEARIESYEEYRELLK